MIRSPLQVGWLGLCGVALLFAFVGRDIREVDIVYTYLMLMLSFPASLLFAGIVAALSTNQLQLPGGLRAHFLPGHFSFCSGMCSGSF